MLTPRRSRRTSRSGRTSAWSRSAAGSPGLELDTLSMGMSGDLEAAIAEGATLVRIGTALFGPRRRD